MTRLLSLRSPHRSPLKIPNVSTSRSESGRLYTDLTFWPRFPRKRSENQWENYLGNVLWMKGRSHAKIQAVLSNMKKRPKIRHKTVMLSALQLCISHIFCKFCHHLKMHELVNFTHVVQTGKRVDFFSVC